AIPGIATTAPAPSGGPGGGGFGGVPGHAGSGLYGGAGGAGGLNRVTGADAVSAAQAVQELKNQSVLQKQRAVQYVGGQAFYQLGAAWVDARYTDRMPTITVKWGSDAYFQIVRQRPDLARALAQG